ncbi:phage terminase small subunit P27 family [Tepidibacter mesophilus]|uniref:phage terminase small subunit P27 family n=1 Tax=Tepidibacter mesophilus TaxID=655607 RepID=UPI000C07D1D3|nr:phage terminase small subunit P27 family [Tepidibacter mesophilus]
MVKTESKEQKTKKETCPSWLDKEAKKEWKRVYKILAQEGAEFTSKDLKTLEIYCRNYSKWKQCENTLLKEGLTFKTPNGYVQQRPEESISNKAQEKMLQGAKELGLTPASRERMNKNSNSNLTKEPIDPEMEAMISK